LCIFLGNQFTTLDGIEFQWSITVLRSKINTVLKFISFKDSLYRTPPDLYELDQKNRQGHMVLVEGVKTGVALVCIFFTQMIITFLINDYLRFLQNYLHLQNQSPKLKYQ